MEFPRKPMPFISMDHLDGKAVFGDKSNAALGNLYDELKSYSEKKMVKRSAVSTSAATGGPTLTLPDLEALKKTIMTSTPRGEDHAWDIYKDLDFKVLRKDFESEFLVKPDVSGKGPHYDWTPDVKSRFFIDPALTPKRNTEPEPDPEPVRCKEWASW